MVDFKREIYGGREPWELKLYTTAAAAHYVGLPLSTAYYWLEAEAKVVGLTRDQRPLNFKNLVELYVLNVLRRGFQARLSKIRTAVRYLQREFKTEYPLADIPLVTDGENVLLHEIGRRLINASDAAPGQLEMEPIVSRYLKRIERGPNNMPLRIYPVTSERAPKRHVVLIDPAVQFGRPCIAGTRIKTEIVFERYEAGDSIAALAEDYGVTPRQISETLSYERGTFSEVHAVR